MPIQVCDPITVPRPIPLSGVNHHGHSFQMIIITRDKAYGRDLCLVHHEDEPLVAFHDTTHGVDGHGYGEFTCGRYYVSTLLEGVNSGRGLDLNGGVDVWKLTPAQMSEARAILESRFPQD